MHRKKAVILIIAAIMITVILCACTQEGEQIIKDFPDARIESYTDALSNSLSIT